MDLQVTTQKQARLAVRLLGLPWFKDSRPFQNSVCPGTLPKNRCPLFIGDHKEQQHKLRINSMSAAGASQNQPDTLGESKVYGGYDGTTAVWGYRFESYCFQKLTCCCTWMYLASKSCRGTVKPWRRPPRRMPPATMNSPRKIMAHLKTVESI